MEGFLLTDVLADSWVLDHRGFSVIRPRGLSRQFMIAFMVSQDSPLLIQFLDYWLSLEHTGEVREKYYNYWVKRQPQKSKTPRWSILHNVLHR